MAQRGVTEKVTTAVSQLGGPVVAPDDIAWALDLPAGRQLLEFLADQIQDTETNRLKSRKGAEERARHSSAALHRIALENDEVRS